MKRTTIDKLDECARFVQDLHPTGAPDAAFVAFGMATEYLRTVVGNDWTNQMVFGEHHTVGRRSRLGRAFMRAEAPAPDDEHRNQLRTWRIAQLLFNLQDVEGIDARLEDLRSGNVESTYGELEAGAFLARRGVRFRYVNPSGLKGADYDAEIVLPDGVKVNCEMKSKAERTECGEGAVHAPLQAARKQLPPGEPGLVFLKVPEAWVFQRETELVVVSSINGFLRGTSRVLAVVLRWEEQHLSGVDGGALTLYKYRVERGTPVKPVLPTVEQLLTTLAGPATAAWVSFYAIAEAAVRGGDEHAVTTRRWARKGQKES